MTNSLVEYLKAIYIISDKHEEARVTDIAKSLGYSKPSVTRALGNLKSEGFVEYPPYGNVRLTERGREIAKDIMKRHDTIKLFLVDVLGIEEDTAEEDAKAMKYAASEHTISKLEQYINKILDLGDLECDYDKASERCKRCLKVTTKCRKGDHEHE